MRDKVNAYRISVGKSKGKRPLRRPRCTWKDNIKMDIRETGRGCMSWIRVAPDRDQQRTPVDISVPYKN
jgi:hypothetical protein